MNEQIDPIFLIDSNILVYGYDKTDKQKHKIAKELLNKCWKKEATYAISTQNLAEFFVIVTKKIPNKLKIYEAEQIINDIINFSHWKVFSYDGLDLQKAISLYKKHFWDSVIAATMINNGVFNIYTENVKDFVFDDIVVVNPFASE